mmetsp:Transcript_41371/g.119021  ORF Transcript_41371/g.119021 Transcript_41371/m.119021 type:complete len:980 (+) Transcript_41371:142-3081(+)
MVSFCAQDGDLSPADAVVSMPPVAEACGVDPAADCRPRENAGDGGGTLGPDLGGMPMATLDTLEVSTGGDRAEDAYTCWMQPAWGPHMAQAYMCDYYGGVGGSFWNPPPAPPEGSMEAGGDPQSCDTGCGTTHHCLWPLEQSGWDAMKDDAFWGGDMSQWPDQSDEAFYQGECQSRGRSKWGSARTSGLSHGEVPRRLNLEAWSKENTPDSEKVTTLMIRNVPNRYDRILLMQELDELGFQGKYDFVYLPIDNSTQWNVGYAFVNFDLPECAKRCMAMLEGHQFFRFRQNNKRVAQVSVAHIQGLEKNLAHCSGTSLFSLRPWFRPWVRNWPSRRDGRMFDVSPGGDFSGAAYASVLMRRGEKAMDADEIAERMREAAAQAVEVCITSLGTKRLPLEKIRRITGGGARRLRILPDLGNPGDTTSGDATGGKGDGESVGLSSPALRECLESLANLPDMAEIEVEIISGIGGEPPFLTTPQRFASSDGARFAEAALAPAAAGRRAGGKASRRRNAAGDAASGDAAADVAGARWASKMQWEAWEMSALDGQEQQQQQAGEQSMEEQAGQQRLEQQQPPFNPYDIGHFDASWPMCSTGPGDGTMGPVMWMTPDMMPGCEMGYYYMQPTFPVPGSPEGPADPAAVRGSPLDATTVADLEAKADRSGQASPPGEMSGDLMSHAASDAATSDEVSIGAGAGVEGGPAPGSIESDCSTDIDCSGRGLDGALTNAAPYMTSGLGTETSLKEVPCHYAQLPQHGMEDPATLWSGACAFIPFPMAERGRDLYHGRGWQIAHLSGQAFEVVRAVSRTPSPSPERHHHHDYASQWAAAGTPAFALLPPVATFGSDQDLFAAVVEAVAPGVLGAEALEPTTAAPRPWSRARSASAGRSRALTPEREGPDVAEALAKEQTATPAAAPAKLAGARRGRCAERGGFGEAAQDSAVGDALTQAEGQSSSGGKKSGAKRAGRAKKAGGGVGADGRCAA